MSESTTRRDFCGGAARIAAGGAAAALGTALAPPQVLAATTPGALDGDPFDASVGGAQVSPEGRLRELGIELPAAVQPVATYVPTVQVGSVLYVAGHTPRMPDGSAAFRGKVGDDFTLEQGREAARFVGLNILSTMRAALGSLDRVARLVRTFGMVNATPDFTQQPQVINGFSDLMVEIFGEEAGKGTRAAVGMGSLPGGMAVEVETYWEIRP
ncbi:MAG: RidA family protein [Longimicrobiales bacterium]|nr:RidA family protein [Longimicrobiales bacterium]